MRFCSETDQDVSKRTLYWSDIKLVLHEFETEVRPVRYKLLSSETSARNCENLNRGKPLKKGVCRISVRYFLQNACSGHKTLNAVEKKIYLSNSWLHFVYQQ